jgi:hypothetical protein
MIMVYQPTHTPFLADETISGPSAERGAFVPVFLGLAAVSAFVLPLFPKQRGISNYHCKEINTI